MAIETVTDRTSAPRRRFTLLDGMILVAATAVGYAGVNLLARLTLPGEVLPKLIPGLASTGRFVELAIVSMMATLPVLVAWTVALISLRLLKPRPRFRRLARQPGWMAGLAVVVAMGFVGVIVLLASVTVGTSTVSDILPEGIAAFPAFSGLAVAVAWTTLIVGRRWRAEPSWVDRLGRAVGVIWVLLALASPLVLLIL